MTTNQLTAYCWRSGLIETSTPEQVPADAMELICGAQKRVLQIISATSRHDRKSDKLYVPGIPEADTEAEAMDAYDGHRAWLAQSHPIMTRRCGQVYPEAIKAVQRNTQRQMERISKSIKGAQS